MNSGGNLMKDGKITCMHGVRGDSKEYECPKCQDIAMSLGYVQDNGEPKFMLFGENWNPPEGTSINKYGTLDIDWDKTPWNVWLNINNRRIPYGELDDKYIVNILFFLRRKVPPMHPTRGKTEDMPWHLLPWENTSKRWQTNDPAYIALVAEAALRPDVDQERFRNAIKDNDWIEELRVFAKAAQRLRGRGIVNARVAMVGHNLVVAMDSPDAELYRARLEEK